MKVFISWSGYLSRALAVELRDWLPMVVHQVDAWMSGRDIEPGQRWALALGRELAQSDFAVICLTRDSRQSPWILFEAGAVARSLEARVVPLLFGIAPSDLDGPLAQFQCVQVDRLGMERLVSRLYDSSSSGLDARQRDLVFARLWPVFEGRLAALTEQARRAVKVESPSDLIADLAALSEDRSKITLDKDVLECLEQERERLRFELQYLKAEEDTGFLDNVVEPTEHRLTQLESTVYAVLDRVFASLSPSQVGILRTLVGQNGTRLLLPPTQGVARHRPTDIESLRRSGLLAIGPQGTMLTHDLIASYILKTSAPA